MRYRQTLAGEKRDIFDPFFLVAPLRGVTGLRTLRVHSRSVFGRPRARRINAERWRMRPTAERCDGESSESIQCRTYAPRPMSTANMRLKEGMFIVSVYPQTWREVGNELTNPRNACMILSTVLADGQNRSLEGYNPQCHLLFDAAPGPNALAEGPRTSPESTKGLSGCPIWQVWRKGESRDPEAWRPEKAKVVAI